MPDTVIRGGMVITPDGPVACDIAVDGGCFSAIGPELPGGAVEIDARGMTVMPGLIDVHVHFNEPGRTDWEGAATGSRALAAGGGTLFFDMPLNSTPCTVDAANFDSKAEALAQSSLTDFALWGGVIPRNHSALDELAERGVIGFKAFMCDSGLPEFPRADDLTLFEAMLVAARHDLPLAVHAESEEITKALAGRMREAGRHDIRAYLDSRPVLAELEAIQRAAMLAKETGARLHIVHISSGRGVALAAELRAQGARITIETCPHYLFFTEEDVERLGAVAKCAPPLRQEQERSQLWRQLKEGVIDIVASDHSPAPPELKQDADFFQVWGGIAGGQSTLAVLLNGGLSMQLIAQVTAATPARRFRIARKGFIAVGFDADFTIIDRRASFTLETSDLFYRHKMSPYTGYTFQGAVKRTVLRGRTIFENGSIHFNQPGQLIRPQERSC